MSIPAPLLDIRRYYVESFHLVSSDDFDKNRSSEGEFDVGFNVTQNAEEPLAYKIDMGVRLEHPTAPYRISLQIVGLFGFIEDTPEDVMVKMIHLNGPAMLYGVARGFVGQATGAARHGQFVLPSVNFIELLKQNMEKAQPEVQKSIDGAGDAVVNKE